MSFDWKKEISVLVYIKEVMSDLDKHHLWQYHLPEVAATEEEIRKTEQHLGFKLNNKYEAFLRHANGWRCFYQSVDLLGTKELKDVDSIKDSIEDCAIKASGLQKEDLLPIGNSLLDTDIFLLAKPSSSHAGEIFWFAGQEIDRFSDFEEFYLAMVDYNRAEVEDLRKES